MVTQGHEKKNIIYCFPEQKQLYSSENKNQKNICFVCCFCEERCETANYISEYKRLAQKKKKKKKKKIWLGKPQELGSTI